MKTLIFVLLFIFVGCMSGGDDDDVQAVAQDDDTADDDSQATDDDAADDDVDDDTDVDDDDTVDDDSAVDDDDDTGVDDDVVDDDSGDDDDTVDTTGMVLISSGYFPMGCEPEGVGCESYEQPRHDVYVSAFYLDVLEVTNTQFVAFLNANGNDAGQYWGEYEAMVHGIVCDGADCWSSPWSVEPGWGTRPVTQVTWAGAVAYCEALGKRLPTEAEWEKAAKGPNHYVWPWSDVEVKYAYNGALEGDPFAGDVPPSTPVGYYDGTDHGGVYQTADGRSGYGIHDMAGNVAEWVSDWFSETYYSETPPGGWENPQGPLTGEYRVLRGGSMDDARDDAETEHRIYDDPRRNIYTIGFRCAWGM